MEKRHSSPEFEVICQKQANAKFFVASFETKSSTGGTTDVAATYDNGGPIGNGTVW